MVVQEVQNMGMRALPRKSLGIGKTQCLEVFWLHLRAIPSVLNETQRFLHFFEQKKREKAFQEGQKAWVCARSRENRWV